MQPRPPTPVRATADDIDQYFERILLDISEGGGGMEPGYRCKTCGWTWAGLGIPPTHLCTSAPLAPPRRIAVVQLSAAVILNIMQATEVSTFKVIENSVPTDAKIVGLSADSALGVISICIESAELPEVSVENNLLPAIWPAVTLKGVTVVAVEDVPETPASLGADL